MVTRDIQHELEACAREYPVITLTGPRQAGKTTLARMAFPGLRYVSVEQPVVREEFHSDPLGFLRRYADGAVFDEVQHVPDLLSYLQVEVDERPESGRFVLTGSQHFGLSARVSQSLAGRTAVLELLPFSVSELVRGGFLADTLDEALWAGAYPPVHDRRLRPQRWCGSYLATYIQRDLRQLTAVQDVDTFSRFLRLAAGNVGQLLNSSRLAGDGGVDHKTIRRWLGLLEASYVAALLPPYYRNFRKRLVKTPKLYFYDTGLVCHLLGIQEFSQLETHPLRGSVFENWVFSEIAKLFRNRGLRPPLHFWRTHGGQEVDFIVEHGGVTLGVEVKAGLTVRPAMLRSLTNALDSWPGDQKARAVVYGGEEAYDLSGCRVVPWRRVAESVMLG